MLHSMAAMPNPWAIMQAGNLYVYTMNNPVFFTDGSGRYAIPIAIPIGKGLYWLGKGIVTLIGGASIVYDVKNTPSISGGSGTGAGTNVAGGKKTNKTAIQIAGGGGGTGDPNDPRNWRNDGTGFNSFNALKRHLGPAGQGNHWHHIVEQSQIKKSGFSAQQIHNTANVVRVSQATHNQITAYYNSKRSFTNGMTVRNWLAGQSFEVQHNFGIQVLRQFGVMP
jgi:hypothetical protein